MNKFLRILGAIIIGEIVLILLSFIAQEIVFNGIRYQTSSWLTLIFGGLLTILAAIIAGIAARLISINHYLIVPSIISLFVILETNWLINTKLTGDPIWFDVLAGLSLVLGIGLGYFYGKLVSKVIKKSVYPKASINS